MKQTYSAGGVVINAEGKILVVNQHGLVWSLPKGHIELGETPLEAARREITEESGLTHLHFIKELGEYDRYKINKNGGDDISEMKHIIMFLFSTSQISLQPLDPENPEARWVDKEKVADLLTHQKDKEFFLKIKSIF